MDEEDLGLKTHRAAVEQLEECFENEDFDSCTTCSCVRCCGRHGRILVEAAREEARP